MVCMKAEMLRRRAAAAFAATTATVALVPAGEDGSASGLTLLSLLPGGIAGMLSKSKPRAPSYEITVDGIHLCGVCHVEPASADAAAAAVARTAKISTVALECDAQTLELLHVATQALAGMAREDVQTSGVDRVQRGLFDSPAVHALASASGKQLTSSAQITLQPAITRHLRNDGVLWSNEMAVAATAAANVGARVVCLKPPGGSWEGNGANSTPAPGDVQGGGVGAMVQTIVGAAACLLRTHILHAGFDERSCAPSGVTAANSAMREMVPGQYERLVTIPNEQMARTLLALRDELRAACTNVDSASAAATTSTSIVAVVGAQHVPGLAQLLGRADGVT